MLFGITHVEFCNPMVAMVLPLLCNLKLMVLQGLSNGRKLAAGADSPVEIHRETDEMLYSSACSEKSP